MQAASPTILQVSPSDIGGGAEKVAVDLHRAYLARGMDAWLALGADHGRVANSLQIPNTRYRSAWARGVLGAAGLSDPSEDSSLPASLRRAARFAAEPSRYRRVTSGLEDFDSPGTQHLLQLTPRTPTVVHLHNLHGSYFDIRQLPSLSSQTPTILTMHDAWILTGHCAQPIDCPGYLTGCVECPALDRYVPIRHDVADQNFRIKRQSLTGHTLRVATPSRWLARMVEDSGVASVLADVRVIPNGVDTAVFAPGDKREARLKLGLPETATILAFAATKATTNQFKGYSTLERALPRISESLRDHEVLLLAVGQDAPAASIGGARIHFVPFVDDGEVMANYYRAANLYLHPARAESFGLTVLEAMACGTPVVATDVGGIPEIVTSGQTGLLVGMDDDVALATAAVALITDDLRRDAFAEAGVLRAREFPFERQVATYLDWYGELADETRLRVPS